jgi:hypothetical protein
MLADGVQGPKMSLTKLLLNLAVKLLPESDGLLIADWLTLSQGAAVSVGCHNTPVDGNH